MAPLPLVSSYSQTVTLAMPGSVPSCTPLPAVAAAGAVILPQRVADAAGAAGLVAEVLVQVALAGGQRHGGLAIAAGRRGQTVPSGSEVWV